MKPSVITSFLAFLVMLLTSLPAMGNDAPRSLLPQLRQAFNRNEIDKALLLSDSIVTLSRRLPEPDLETEKMVYQLQWDYLYERRDLRDVSINAMLNLDSICEMIGYKGFRQQKLYLELVTLLLSRDATEDSLATAQFYIGKGLALSFYNEEPDDYNLRWEMLGHVYAYRRESLNEDAKSVVESLEKTHSYFMKLRSEIPDEPQARTFRDMINVDLSNTTIILAMNLMKVGQGVKALKLIDNTFDLFKYDAGQLGYFDLQIARLAVLDNLKRNSEIITDATDLLSKIPENENTFRNICTIRSVLFAAYCNSGKNKDGLLQINAMLNSPYTSQLQPSTINELEKLKMQIQLNEKNIVNSDEIMKLVSRKLH